MRAPITVIIPTLNAAKTLPRCLMALAEGLQAGLIRDLVISDGGSQDETSKLAEAAGAIVVTGPASRGGQLRKGAEVAEGAWLLFLHADTELAPGWSRAVQAHLTRSEAAYFRLRFASTHPMARITAFWANLRSRVFGLPYGDQGLLISRALYDAVGGFPDQPLMEDVALARALRSRLRGLPAEAITSADRYHRDGWLRRGAGNLRLLLRYLAGAHPDELAARYRKS